LTVTINAAKSSIPSGSATPVSLVAREILQYARNIPEAVAIARRRTMFVSESFLVGSAEDHKAVIIEKTPDTLDVYDPHSDRIICANHFQGNTLGKSKPNIEQMDESASAYRYDRLVELLNQQGPNTVEKTVAVLRDYRGKHNSNIGIGNEKALNQFIAHHSIVFEPQKLLVWVSTAPWQMGQYIAYDLNKVFALRGMKEDREVCDSSRIIAADPFLVSGQYQQFRQFRAYAQRIADKQSVNVDSMVADNPEFYHAYVLAGDYLFKQKQFGKALHYYEIALTKEIATKKEREHVEEQVKKCKSKVDSH
jgi:isopenicillin-N N-acyltransferase-like protein